jgi:hypothetical protein
MVAQLRINQIHIDLFPLYVPSLCHLRQRARQIDNCVAPVVLGEEEHGEVLTLLCGVVACVGGGRGGCAEGESWFACGTKVGFEGCFDGGVGLGEVVL